jgi:hypothetical protein
MTTAEWRLILLGYPAWISLRFWYDWDYMGP